MGSLDGIVVTMYEEGKEYEVNEDLFGAFSRMEVCEEVAEKKAIEEAPQNKMKAEKVKNK